MLRYWLTSLSLTALALVAHGETVVADSLYSLTIDTPLQEMIYHLRFRPDKNNDARYRSIGIILTLTRASAPNLSYPR